MIKKDRALLRRLAQRPCELCNGRFGTAAHHVFARGMGGGGRLDVTINLITLCSTCHRKVHDGHIKRELLLKLIAWRENSTPEEIEKQIHELRRRPK